MPRGRAISVLSLAVGWAKLKKNDKVRHNMTQIASLLAVATVFYWLMDSKCLHFAVGRGAYSRHKTTYAETQDKNAGGGIIAGFYGTYYSFYFIALRVVQDCH